MMTLVASILALCVVLLLWVVASQVRHIKQLSGWLKTPDKPLKAQGIAQAFGDWQGVFYQLEQQEINRKNRASRLNHAVHRLNRMMIAIPSAVLIINKKGVIEWKNARADAYLSLKDSKAPLKEQVASPEFSAFLDSIMSQTHTEAKLQLGQRTLFCTLIPIEANASMLIAHDVSASEQLNISKNTFIANVSHELRTPLTVIQGFLEMLLDKELNDELRQEFVGLMQKESARMLDLIEELLTLSRLENDDDPAKHSEPICLSDMITDIAKDAQNLSSTHQISTDITPEIWVKGVYKELYSAFSNLIFNAVRHTESGTKVHVHLSVDKEICFFVQDEGDGISGEHLAHLTERFYRVDKGRSRKTGGTGLGLAIAKHALARHHASLTIQSEVGVGSVFGVVMPKGE